MTGRKSRPGLVDPTDPVAVRFIERIGVLTPSAWDAIDARIDAIAASWPREPTPPGVERMARILTPIFELFDPSPETLRAAMRQAGKLSSKLLLAYVEPAWRRQGTGPARHLTELLDRGYITTQLRFWVVLTLLAIRLRSRADSAEALRDFYAPFEPVIPWASLVPPLLPRSVEASPIHPR